MDLVPFVCEDRHAWFVYARTQILLGFNGLARKGNLRSMATLSGKVTLIFSFLSPFPIEASPYTERNK